MKKYLAMSAIAVLGLAMFSCDDDEAEEYTLSAYILKADSCYISNNTTNKVDNYYYRDDIQMAPFKLVHSFASWGFGFGFTYSNLTDTITPGYSNLSAITGTGHNGNTYFSVSTGGDYSNLPADISFIDGNSYNAKGVYVTNSTYAYLAIKYQNDGNIDYITGQPAPLVKKWTDEDLFTLTITGINGNDTTGVVTFNLAEGLNIVDDWEYVDLTKLGRVSKISFSLNSTDKGLYCNTPTYFCLDDLTVSE